MALIYANLYVDETDVIADNLANIFRAIVDSALHTTTREEFNAKKIPR